MIITNLFSVFDPCTGILSLNWIRSLIFIIVIPYKFWVTPNKIILSFNLILNIIQKEINVILPYKGASIIILSLFLFILINNLIGLTPHTFTSSSHLIYSLGLILPLWLALIIYGWINKKNSIFSHLVPTGTPFILIPFIVLIETVRNIIRPGSLSVRLTANMIAGHLLISLLGNNTTTILIIISTIIIYTGLIIFELAVAVIQSYVYITLAALYSREI